MALDLSLFIEKYWDLTLPSKEELQIKKPTQELVIKMIAIAANPIFNGKAKNKDADKILDTLIELAVDILNNNTNDKQFTKDEINKTLTLDMLTAIIQEYTKFMYEVLDNPN